MSARKKCEQVDSFQKTFYRILYCFTPTDSSREHQFPKLILSIVNEENKKFRIVVPDNSFACEFYQEGANDIIFHLTWKSDEWYKSTGNAEKAASELFYKMLSYGRFKFERIEMEAIRKPANYEEAPNFCPVQNLVIKIPDDYENGQLQWWINKFQKECLTMIIETSKTSEVDYHVSEHIKIPNGLVEFRGRFIVPQEVFAKMKARFITVKDSSSENINEDYVVHIVEYWLNNVPDAERPKKIILTGARYEDSDIGKELYRYLKNNKYEEINSRGRTEFMGVVAFKIPDEYDRYIWFNQDGEHFNLNITPIDKIEWGK